jgi:hypothetical protein
MEERGQPWHNRRRRLIILYWPRPMIVKDPEARHEIFEEPRHCRVGNMGLIACVDKSR